MNHLAAKTAKAKRAPGKRPFSRGRLASGQPNPIDTHVGARVRLRRTLLGMSQEKLGEAIGTTFQQVQKYEKGANRIGCSRLYDLARVLDVPLAYFFDDMAEAVAANSPARLMAGIGPIEPPAPARGPSRLTLELAREFQALPQGAQAHVLNIVRSTAKLHDQPEGEG